MHRTFMVAFCLCATPVLAQQPGDAATAAPRATEQGILETTAAWIQHRFGDGKPKDGFYPEFGGLPPDSGVSAGPGFRHALFNGHALVDASGAVSWSRGRFGQAAFELPHLAGDRLRVGTQATWQDFTRIGYFGVGSASLDADRTYYGLTNADYGVFAALKARAGLTIGGRLGFTPRVTIERTNSSTYPATQDLFTGVTAPGLFEQPAFLHGDAYIHVDTRDHHHHPTRGGAYRVTVSDFRDRDVNLYSFRRLEAEVSQYFPLHENGVIALHGRVAASHTALDNTVPFYLLPTIGGSTTLRGYDDYRFRDRNALLLNAEYRRTIAGALDGVVFYDAGTVAPHFGGLDNSSLKTAYGVGVRFHSNETTFVRIDVGRSREGTRLILSIDEIFRPGHGSIVIPYVP